MTKTRLISIASVLSTTTLLPGLALGVDVGGIDIGIKPRVEAGVMNYKYESSSIGTSEVFTGGSDNFTRERLKYKDTMPTLGGGLTFFADRFFFDFSGQKAFNGSDGDSVRSSYSLFLKPDIADSYTDNTNYQADFDRREYALSLGYAITDQFSVFGGYKWAKTQFDTKGRGVSSELLIIGDQSFSGGGSFEIKSNYDFKYDGPFVGLAYSLKDIKQGFLDGDLNFNFAAARLDGEVEAKNIQLTIGDQQFEAGRFSSKGDTTGLTFAVSWVGYTPVKGINYLLGFNAYSYSFKAKESSNPDIDETVYQFKAGLSYSF